MELNISIVEPPSCKPRSDDTYEEGKLQDSILVWWKNRESQFSTLYKIVPDELAIQASLVGSEKEFSAT
uniref:HAT C-terminal dimerisation domain-containing protein n=1 Tax=Solanum lycopersicum TaxID=4081 RepID=A0A3Q7GJ98_SOLLC